MIAAAQQHMQKNLTSKLLSIGVPLSRFGIPSSGPDNTTESIPLPGDPVGVDMDIADIPAPPMQDIPFQTPPDIPLPPAKTQNSASTSSNIDDDCAPPGVSFDDDCGPPGDDDGPPGE